MYIQMFLATTEMCKQKTKNIIKIMTFVVIIFKEKSGTVLTSGSLYYDNERRETDFGVN